MRRRNLLALIVCCAVPMAAGEGSDQAKNATAGAWKFAVSGDSRNCGNVVMPAIAAAVKKENAEFYWHLGDYRAIYKFDEDYLAEPNIQRDGKDPTISGYLSAAWTDFLSHQIAPFGNLPVYLAPGNHETIPPKSHEEFMKKFATWFDSPLLKNQRLQDNPLSADPASYYHWIQGGIDFISLDNSMNASFDEAQLNWLVATVSRDEGDDKVKTIVVGMHAALPDSFSASHSMCSSPQGIASGRAAYHALVQAKKVGRKNIYVLSSHSHFYMENIYNTSYWKDSAHGGVVLPGWIIGTAGAVRYKSPADLPSGTVTKTREYGYLLGLVAPDATITFSFRPFAEDDLQQSRTADYSADFVHQCFAANPPVAEMKWDTTNPDPCGENLP